MMITISCYHYRQRSYPQVSIATEIVSSATSNTGMSTAIRIMMMGMRKSDSMQTEDTTLWKSGLDKKENSILRQKHFVRYCNGGPTNWLVNFQSLLTRKRPKWNLCDFSCFISSCICFTVSRFSSNIQIMMSIKN